MSELIPPQLVINSRMLYFGWIPADPGAVEALLPDGLRVKPNTPVFMNQYVVDNEEQTSHFGKYSLTYAGVDVDGLDVNPAVPARWWTHYWTSSPAMTKYAADTGVPARDGGHTELDLQGDTLIATTFDNGKPIVRTTVTVGPEGDNYVRSHLRYITKMNGELWSGHYPAIGRCADNVVFKKLEFLDRSHDIFALAPKEPLDVPWGFYFTKAAFCYPGGFRLLSADELAAAS